MNSTASRRQSWIVCTWHLPVRGKVEKRKHMDRASSRSRSASMNVGYLRSQGAALTRPLRLVSRGPPTPLLPPVSHPRGPVPVPGHHHLLDREPGHAPGAWAAPASPWPWEALQNWDEPA